MEISVTREPGLTPPPRGVACVSVLSTLPPAQAAALLFSTSELRPREGAELCAVLAPSALSPT